jgi:ADP-heptose:LPS heptosyltransferase
MKDSRGDNLLSRHPSPRTLYIESCANTDPRTGSVGDSWGLGDGIFRLPAIAALARTSGQPVDVLTAPGREPVFRGSEGVGDVLTPNGRLLDTLVRIRANGYTHVFSLHPGWRMLLLTALSGAEVRKIAMFPIQSLQHDNHIDVGIKTLAGIVPDLADAPDRPRMARERPRLLPEGYFYIGLNIGASSGHRHFHDWEAVLRRVAGEIPENVRFVLIGKHHTRGVDLELARKFPSRVIDLAGRLDLESTYDLIAQCDAFIGADGGNVNAAVALLDQNVFPIYGLVG